MDGDGKEAEGEISRGMNALRATPTGILRVDSGKTRRTSLDIKLLSQNAPASPQPSVDRLSVTFADDSQRSDRSETSPKSMDKVRFPAGNTDEENSEEEDYSASVTAIMQRRASTRRSKKRSGRRGSSPFSPDILPENENGRRRSSVFTTSSGDTAITMEDSFTPSVTQDQIFENIKLHKEVLGSVKMQPWNMRKKLRLVVQAKSYIKRHEGALQERLAQSHSTRDMLARCNIYLIKKWQQSKREAANLSNWLIPWERRIKEIESHFGSVVASYFIFLRWLFWVNMVISIVLIAFVAVPEMLMADFKKDPERKAILPEDRYNSTNFLTLWDFEGVFKYSAMFYGWYTNLDLEDKAYRLPLAYFFTGLAVYVYSFVATLRKMAKNSRMSKLSEKEDECIFSWKLFTGWDYMIGNAETAHNRVASIVMSFKEALLEEAEKKRESKSWKLIGSRILVNTGVLGLLFLSAFAVVTVVARSNEKEANSTTWRRNEITVVMSLISLFFPIFFELLGYFEHYHPRKQLRLQLARIMVLNLLNLYSLIFALFGKISNMTHDLQALKPPNTTRVPFNYNTTSPIFSTLPTQSTEAFFNSCYTTCEHNGLVAANLINSALNNWSQTFLPTVPTSQENITQSIENVINNVTKTFPVNLGNAFKLDLSSFRDKIQDFFNNITDEGMWDHYQTVAPATTEAATTVTTQLTTVMEEITSTIRVNITDCRLHCEISNATLKLPLLSGYKRRSRLRSLCWETMFGQELMKLTVMDLVMMVLSTLAIDFLRGLFVRYMNNCWCWDLEKTFPQYGDFKVAENILHLVNNQGMVWMGMFFSPGLVVLNVFKLYVMMYLRSWAVLACNVPHEIIFRASRSNNFYFALLLMMLFLCVLPVGYTIVWLEPSWHCGPFSKYHRIFHIFTKTIRKALPEPFHKILDYIASPGIVIPLLMLLVLIIYYLISLTNALREANNDLKIQLRRERTEERRKMFQIADKRLRRSASGGSGDLNSKWKKLLQGMPGGGKSFDDTPKESSEIEQKAAKHVLSRFIFRSIKNRKQSISDEDSVLQQDDGTDTEQHESLPDDARPLKLDSLEAGDKPFRKGSSLDSEKRLRRLESLESTDRKLGLVRSSTESGDKHVTIRGFQKKEAVNRVDSLSSNWSENIPVITISKTESSECILEAVDGHEVETKPKIRYMLKKQVSEIGREESLDENSGSKALRLLRSKFVGEAKKKKNRSTDFDEECGLVYKSSDVGGTSERKKANKRKTKQAVEERVKANDGQASLDQKFDDKKLVVKRKTKDEVKVGDQKYVGKRKIKQVGDGEDSASIKQKLEDKQSVGRRKQSASVNRQEPAIVENNLEDEKSVSKNRGKARRFLQHFFKGSDKSKVVDSEEREKKILPESKLSIEENEKSMGSSPRKTEEKDHAQREPSEAKQGRNKLYELKSKTKTDDLKELREEKVVKIFKFPSLKKSSDIASKSTRKDQEDMTKVSINNDENIRIDEIEGKEKIDLGKYEKPEKSTNKKQPLRIDLEKPEKSEGKGIDPGKSERNEGEDLEKAGDKESSDTERSLPENAKYLDESEKSEGQKKCSDVDQCENKETSFGKSKDTERGESLIILHENADGDQHLSELLGEEKLLEVKKLETSGKQWPRTLEKFGIDKDLGKFYTLEINLEKPKKSGLKEVEKSEITETGALENKPQESRNLKLEFENIIETAGIGQFKIAKSAQEIIEIAPKIREDDFNETSTKSDIDDQNSETEHYKVLREDFKKSSMDSQECNTVKGYKPFQDNIEKIDNKLKEVEDKIKLDEGKTEKIEDSKAFEDVLNKSKPQIFSNNSKPSEEATTKYDSTVSEGKSNLEDTANMRKSKDNQEISELENASKNSQLDQEQKSDPSKSKLEHPEISKLMQTTSSKNSQLGGESDPVKSKLVSKNKPEKGNYQLEGNTLETVIEAVALKIDAVDNSEHKIIDSEATLDHSNRMLTAAEEIEVSTISKSGEHIASPKPPKNNITDDGIRAAKEISDGNSVSKSTDQTDESFSKTFDGNSPKLSETSNVDSNKFSKTMELDESDKNIAQDTAENLSKIKAEEIQKTKLIDDQDNKIQGNQSSKNLSIMKPNADVFNRCLNKEYDESSPKYSHPDYNQEGNLLDSFQPQINVEYFGHASASGTPKSPKYFAKLKESSYGNLLLDEESYKYISRNPKELHIEGDEVSRKALKFRPNTDDEGMKKTIDEIEGRQKSTKVFADEEGVKKSSHKNLNRKALKFRPNIDDEGIKKTIDEIEGRQNSRNISADEEGVKKSTHENEEDTIKKALQINSTCEEGAIKEDPADKEAKNSLQINPTDEEDEVTDDEGIKKSMPTKISTDEECVKKEDTLKKPSQINSTDEEDVIKKDPADDKALQINSTNEEEVTVKKSAFKENSNGRKSLNKELPKKIFTDDLKGMNDYLQIKSTDEEEVTKQSFHSKAAEDEAGINESLQINSVYIDEGSKIKHLQIESKEETGKQDFLRIKSIDRVENPDNESALEEGINKEDIMNKIRTKKCSTDEEESPQLKSMDRGKLNNKSRNEEYGIKQSATSKSIDIGGGTKLFTKNLTKGMNTSTEKNLINYNFPNTSKTPIIRQATIMTSYPEELPKSEKRSQIASEIKDKNANSKILTNTPKQLPPETEAENISVIKIEPNVEEVGNDSYLSSREIKPKLPTKVDDKEQNVNQSTNLSSIKYKPNVVKQVSSGDSNLSSGEIEAKVLRQVASGEEAEEVQNLLYLSSSEIFFDVNKDTKSAGEIEANIPTKILVDETAEEVNKDTKSAREIETNVSTQILAVERIEEVNKDTNSANEIQANVPTQILVDEKAEEVKKDIKSAGEVEANVPIQILVDERVEEVNKDTKSTAEMQANVPTQVFVDEKSEEVNKDIISAGEVAANVPTKLFFNGKVNRDAKSASEVEENALTQIFFEDIQPADAAHIFAEIVNRGTKYTGEIEAGVPTQILVDEKAEEVNRDIKPLREITAETIVDVKKETQSVGEVVANVPTQIFLEEVNKDTKSADAIESKESTEMFVGEEAETGATSEAMNAKAKSSKSIFSKLRKLKGDKKNKDKKEVNKSNPREDKMKKDKKEANKSQLREDQVKKSITKVVNKDETKGFSRSDVYDMFSPISERISFKFPGKSKTKTDANLSTKVLMETVSEQAVGTLKSLEKNAEKNLIKALVDDDVEEESRGEMLEAVATSSHDGVKLQKRKTDSLKSPTAKSQDYQSNFNIDNNSVTAETAHSLTDKSINLDKKTFLPLMETVLQQDTVGILKSLEKNVEGGSKTSGVINAQVDDGGLGKIKPPDSMKSLNVLGKFEVLGTNSNINLTKKASQVQGSSKLKGNNEITSNLSPDDNKNVDKEEELSTTNKSKNINTSVKQSKVVAREDCVLFSESSEDDAIFNLERAASDASSSSEDSSRFATIKRGKMLKDIMREKNETESSTEYKDSTISN